MRSQILNLLTLSLAFAASTGAVNSKPPKGFVTTKGTDFVLDGKPFAFVGANSYWLPLLTTPEDVETTFKEMRDAGIKVLRTWGFNAITQDELAGAKASGLTYYQVWNGTRWALNDGPQGLQRLDHVIDVAGKYGIKVILAFTNNWVGYGGLELYVKYIAGGNSTHDVFYNNPSIISEYQRYVKLIVDRYKKSPNIFAWELMNEARCLGDLPGGPACAPGTGLLNKWYKSQSDFVRSLDPNHLITTGGEGHFNQENPVHYWYNGQYVSDYNFNGQAGEDFDRDLVLDNIDFGTYHMYPQYWYPELDVPNSNFTLQDWGLTWMDYHVKSANKANKPLILEEFGVSGFANKTTIYPVWVDHALKTKHAGIMPWQFGQLGLKENGGNKIFKYADALVDGASPNDGFAIYKNQSAIWNIFTHAAKVQAARFSN